jgi:hypothetical protein
VIDSLKTSSLAIPRYFTLRRNEARNKLYVSPYDSPIGPAVIVVSSNAVRVVPCPGRIVYLNAADEVVAWSNDLSKGVQFTNGYFLRLPEFGLFDVSSSGDYFIISAKPTSTWVGRTARPESRTCISTNTLASHVFEAGGKLYVTGQTYRPTATGSFIQTAVCLVLAPRTNDFELVDTIAFSVSASIEDVSESGDQILLKDGRDFSSYWLLYDARTMKTETYESASDWCFFMKDDVFRKEAAH